ncbi:putative flagellar protein [Treponema primitia ZAS-2]|uniref:Putative flagellar protein n=1 Tax=Treponema primitia (strain ATCC BAA-887 / DSM 12427 / ZAS-2) TaxID=545694 RepID=F5YIZ1_TREPZ|nr:rod-binding protein [Treponema primitia]AEF85642.1 putative flagellar protein [Treponema primitia ZAS-2]
MDISALGSYYLNESRFEVKAPTATATPAAGTESGNNAFAALLEQAKMDEILSSVPTVDNATMGDEAAGDRAASETRTIPFSTRKPVIDREDKLYEQCLSLETFLVKTLITGMRGTVQKSGLMDDSFAGNMYEDMLYDKYAETYTKNAKFGLADMAYLELTGQRGKVITRN